MDVLVAGCGTNQAAVLAYTNPEAHITAVDISQSSLNHHQYLKNRYKLKNLTLHHLPIEDLPTLQSDYDLIISTGVLHHLADPQKGMAALAQCLRPDGVIALMLYARFGRIGVEMLQTVFRELGLSQNDLSVLMVKDALGVLTKDHPIWSYIQLAPDLQYDAGLVDTFLHGRERSYTIAECVEFANVSGLVFQDLFIKAPYYPPANASGAFLSSVATLPESQQWSVMERINFRNGCHFFTACRADRAPENYRVDFNSDKALQYIPCFRLRCCSDGDTLIRSDWRMPLDALQAELALRIDGNRSIRDIVELVAKDAPIQRTVDDVSANGLEFFRSIWQLDFITVSFS